MGISPTGLAAPGSTVPKSNFGITTGPNPPPGFKSHNEELYSHAAAAEKAAAAQEKLEAQWARGTKVIEEEMTPAVEMLSGTIQSMGDMVAGSFANAIVEGEKFNDILDEILKNLAKMAINAVMQHFIQGAIGSPTVGGEGGGILGSFFHGGGVVGKSGALRNLPAALFANAPRLHNGLMPDEFPAILQRGEKVTPRGGGGVSITIIDKNDSDVKASSSESDNGDLNIELLIDQVASKKMNQPGSAMNRTLNQMGVRQSGIRR